MLFFRTLLVRAQNVPPSRIKNPLSILFMLAMAIMGNDGQVEAGEFHDGFEEKVIHTFWNVSEEVPDSVNISSNAHSGLQSVALSAFNGYNGGSGVWHVFPFLAKGAVSCWFYDSQPGQQTRYGMMTLYNATIPYANPGNQFSVGVLDWDPDNYIVVNPATGQSVVSGVRRTRGWHFFEIIIGDRGGEYRIDGATVFTFEGSYAFTQISLEVFGPSWRPSATFYFDEVSVNWNMVAPRFMPLGDLSGGSTWSRARRVSGDGLVVVGTSSSDSGVQAFRWGNGILYGLGDLDGGAFGSEGSGVSADGSVIVGNSSSENSNGQHGDREAFRWEDGTMVGLGDLPGDPFLSEAHAVSSDGRVVVGRAYSTGNEAFRWQDGEMLGLGDLPGGSFDSIAFGVSADSSVIVGYSSSENGPVSEACRWVNGEIGGLGDLPGGEFKSVANDVSLDGSVIVGWGTSESGMEAAMWDGGSVAGLGDLPGGGFESTAFGVSGDGEIIVGYGTTDTGREAFLWSRSEGLQNLREWLVTEGVEIPSGWRLTGAYDISDDGTTVVGEGINPDGNTEGWLVRLPASEIPCDAIRRLKVECASGTLSARLKSSLPAGTELTLDNNGDQRKTVTINARGKGKARWTHQVGVHIVTVVECPEQSRVADCG